MTEFLNRTLDNLHKGPLGPVVRLVEAHPRLSAWFVLALGMVILLVIEASHVGLLPGQWAALIIATILVAGACVWIISWEDEAEPEEEKQAAPEQLDTSAASEEASPAPKKRTRKTAKKSQS